MSKVHMPIVPPRRAISRGVIFILAFIAGGLVWLTVFYGGLWLLRRTDRLPPTPVSGTWCIDSRLAWLKDNPRWKQAELIAVGSSVTWRNLDFEVISAPDREKVVNAAPCYLTINQTRYLTSYLVEKAPDVKTVMMVVAPRDFDGCARNPDAFFDRELVDDYLNRRVSGMWLRFRNFRARDVLTYAVNAEQRRSDLVYDDHGSGPLTRQVPDIGWAVEPETACFAELTGMAQFLDSKNIQFVLVTLPLMRGWSERYDPEQSLAEELRLRIAAALEPTRAILVDGIAEWQLPTEAFADPAHLQWPQTAAFTEFVWNAAQKRGAQLPPLRQTTGQSK